ncbi:leucine-rich protein [Streptococcus pneumoniae]|nr:leucine-rich protein [Streptococcus pneumoniae]
MIDVNLINGIALAFEGDAVYSMYIRRHLILKGMTKPNKLHQEATKYVSAKAQARLIALMLEEQVLTEKEEEIYKRGRNTNSHTKAKNADVVTYRMSTGHQALSDLIKAERDLFKTWWRQGHQGVHTFSQLYLWSMGERLVDLKPIKECLHQMILDQDQIQEIILSLWENSAVLTKTAQQLYLHRNSLQYKIDKWEELTGLQLKELTDLTLCYQLILGSLSTIVGL